MMKITTLLSITLVAFALSACTSSPDTSCSTAANVNNPECQKQIPNVDSRPLTLSVSFVDSFYYDQNSKSWQTLSKNNLDGGIAGATLQIYSDFLNITTKAAMVSILASKTQHTNPGSYAETDLNRIPYIEVSPEDGVDYIYDYTKTDINSNIVYQKQGKMVIQDGRAILPMINETFDGQFFAATNTTGANYKHTISIAAQSSDKKGTRTSNIVFDANLQIPNTDFYVSMSDAANAFTLPNRWKYYFNGVDNQPNTAAPFISLKEIKTVSEQVPLKLKIQFQAPPSVQIVQDVFFEMPFNVNEIISTSKVNPQRGYNFYVQRQNLSGTLPSPQGPGPDFQMKLRVDGQDLALTSGGTEANISLAAGVPWNIDVFYDFTQHANYSNPGGTGVITPLKPVCNQDKGESFLPLTMQAAKDAAIASGGYMAICHPSEDRQVIIAATDMATTPYAKSDTWFGHFSYVPYDIFNREVGHFYGIRSVTLRMTGCVRIQVLEPGQTQYVIKSKTNPVCDIAGGGENQGWVSFYAEKTATIFDNINDYEGITGLKSLMQSFGARPIQSTPNFYFNGSDLKPTRKIY